MAGSLGNPDSLNRYVYARDRPISVADPSGALSQACFFAIFAILGAVVAAIALVSFLVSAGPAGAFALILGILSNLGATALGGLAASFGFAGVVIFQVLTIVAGIVSAANLQQTCSS